MIRPCTRCLLTPGQDGALYETVQAYLAALPAHRKAPEADYRRRLAQCSGCPHLRQGLCALCGCYVQVRCAKRALSCPDVPPRWAALPPDAEA